MMEINKDLKAVADALTEAQDIALLSHVHPDPDTIGSSFALKNALEKVGKRVTVYADAPYPENLSFLYDDYIVYSSPKAHELCMSVDCGDLTRIGERATLLELAKVSVNIDHHPTNTKFAKLNCVLPNAAATAQIVDLIRAQMGIEIDTIYATRLYGALVGDTGGFRYSNTTPETMRLGAKMLECGVDNWFVCKTIFEDMPLKTIQLRGVLAGQMRVLDDGKICAVVLTEKLCEQYGLNVDDVDEIVSIPRSVTGCEIAVSFKEMGEFVKISLRSSVSADVSKIALNFGGGGHKRAAGFVLKGKLDEVIERVLNEAHRTIEEIK